MKTKLLALLSLLIITSILFCIGSLLFFGLDMACGKAGFIEMTQQEYDTEIKYFLTISLITFTLYVLNQKVKEARHAVATKQELQ